MTKKYKVKTKAVFDGQPLGSTIELNESLTKKYESLGYLEIIEEVKKPKPKAKPAKKAKSAPKKRAKDTAKKEEK